MNDEVASFFCGLGITFGIAMLMALNFDRNIETKVFEKGQELCQINGGLDSISHDVVDYTFFCSNGAKFFIQSKSNSTFQEEK